ncbi:GRF zinc finger / Zinc knuckle protein [Perilla frutescens var. hirtella]|nr:GRF zinc finger / Zinc knuckle protein [Perilla frutescens var. hirtella]
MSSLSLRGILDTCKLAGENFDEWYRNLRNVLMHEKLINVIDKPAPKTPYEKDVEATSSYQKYMGENLNAKCIIIVAMGPSLQRQHQDMEPPAIIEHIKKMYGAQSITARYQLSKTLFKSTLTANSHVGPHVLKMIDLIEQLEKLGYVILQSLHESFSQFIVNFNMNKMSCELHEMLNMLIDYENQVGSEKPKGSIMFVGDSSKRKGNGKKKFKRKPTTPKGNIAKPKAKHGKTDQSDAECFHCKQKGHWKINYKKYLASLENKKQGNHGEEIDLDEINEIIQAQEHERQIEQPLLDVLKLTQRLPSSIVEDQEHVDEPVLEQVQTQEEHVGEKVLENPVQEVPTIREPLRRSKRICHAPDRLNLMVQDNEIIHDDDPKTCKEALQSSDAEKWQNFMESCNASIPGEG